MTNKTKTTKKPTKFATGLALFHENIAKENANMRARRAQRKAILKARDAASLAQAVKSVRADYAKPLTIKLTPKGAEIKFDGTRYKLGVTLGGTHGVLVSASLYTHDLTRGIASMQVGSLLTYDSVSDIAMHRIVNTYARARKLHPTVRGLGYCVTRA